jgi:hypothetical protein
MCGGGGNPPPAPPPTPPPAPLPAAIPSDVNPQLTSQQRQAKISALKFGALSTVKTSPQGVAGAGPDIQTPSASGQKKTVGG